MPIENEKSNLFGSTDATTGASSRTDKRIAQATTHRAYGTVANAADALSGSTYAGFKLPSHAILLETTEFKTSAWGFAQAVCSVVGSPAKQLFDAAKAGNKNPVVLFDATGHGKELWELLGYTEDPRGDITLEFVAEADATAAGQLDFVIDWAID